MPIKHKGAIYLFSYFKIFAMGEFDNSCNYINVSGEVSANLIFFWVDLKKPIELVFEFIPYEPKLPPPNEIPSSIIKIESP